MNGQAAADLLDVFNSFDGSVIFRGLTQSVGGQAPVLGRIGWIFTALGALMVLWGFVLRSRASSGEGRLGEIARTWIVIAFMIGGPLLMTAAMEGADSVYTDTVGGPAALTATCVKAAYAMPELNNLFDTLRKEAVSGESKPPAGSPEAASLINSANDGSVLGYLEAFGAALWDTGSGYAAAAGETWGSLVRMAAVATGLGAAIIKCLLIALTIAPLYLMLLASAAIIWFMEQLRYFLAVSGTMMLPLFVGMYSLPEGHPNRQAAHAYVMNMVSIALWPIAWSVGHTGTAALYNALVSLIAGTSRVPDMVAMMQWGALTNGSPSADQVRAAEAALGNWFMGNIAGLLSILVGGLGFFMWILAVSVLGPVMLHRMLSSGAHFMAEAASGTYRGTFGAARLALSAAQGYGSWGGLAGLRPQPAPGERLASAEAVNASAIINPPQGPASMGSAARGVDDSGGKRAPSV
jgi:hypothetical protein